jgi:hypothetical protein
MSLIQSETYDALLAAGTPEPQARDAAKVMADADMRVITMAERLNGLDSKLTIIMWIMGIGFSVMLGGFAATSAALWQVFLRLPR